jgi:phospholipid/cholesterol/gamma-HCH transport system permease protein
MTASVRIEKDTGLMRLICQGEWRTLFLRDVDQVLRNLNVGSEKIILDLKGITQIDTAGAWVLHRFFQEHQDKIKVEGKTKAIENLLKGAEKDIECRKIEKAPHLFCVWAFLEELGEKSTQVGRDALSLLSFLGEIVVAMLRLVRRPRAFRMTSTVYHLQQVGLRALPIVGLISFLIGVVLVYQGANQLKRFGAEVFTVDLLAVSVLREIGILLTSIVVAGRSGSAFTAQIGYMQLNQEIDAMRVMSLDPVVYLVLPRMIALMIALPLLGFFSDIVALAGGALMGRALIGLTLEQFFTQLHLTIAPWTFWTGIIKAPFFAFVIGLVGCFEGLRVKGGADSVGTQTTRAVVRSIFLVIVFDAAFSIFFSYIGV